MKILSDRLDANGSPLYVPIGSKTLTVDSKTGQVDAKRRHFDYLLTYDAAQGGWPLPTGATDLTVQCNGLRYGPWNYTVAAGVLKAKFANMQPGDEVTADYFA